MKLFITEKPSVAMKYAEYLNIAQDKRDGYTEGYSDVLNENIVITWAIGHLVTMSYPEAYDERLKDWSLETLPFLPDTYKYEVISNVKHQFYIIKKLYFRKDLDCIYFAGDSGREGIYIQALIRMVAGAKGGIEEKVVWLNSITRDEVIRGIKTAKPIKEYKTLINAGFARAIEDYAIGINFSRLLALKYRNEFNAAAGANKTVLAVGRVFTCVLALIVDRELSITNFKKTKWYKVIGKSEFIAEWHLSDNSQYKEHLFEDKGFLDELTAKKLTDLLNNDKVLEVISIDKKEEEKKAPLLFNLAELQSECSKRFKISPDKTLEIVQELYEANLVTYPRTDARVLSSALAKEIVKNIKGLMDIYPSIVSTILDNRLYEGIEKTKYVDDKKITDHYAIIPTGEGNKELNDLKKDIYELICCRFLAIFYPAAVFDKSEVRLKHSSGEEFIYKEKVLAFAGYLGITQDILEREPSRISKLQVGDKLKTSFSYEEHETTPPKRFTSGSIILAMETAGKLIEDEELKGEITGIGTSATRADILKRLQTRKYIDINRAQVVTPTNIGNTVYTIVKHTIPELLNPELTAKWEKSLNGIEKGEVEYTDFIKVVEKYITQTVSRVKDMEVIDMGGMNSIGECPLCKKPVYKNSVGGYGCSGYKDGCKFYIGTVFGKNLAASAAADLLKGKVIGPVKGLKNKEGKEFSAKLKLDNGKLIIAKDKVMTDFICPKCNKNLEELKYSYKCECGFNIWHSAFQKKIPKTEMVKILKGEKTGLIKGFKSKEGKEFSASLTWDGERYIIELPKRSI